MGGSDPGLSPARLKNGPLYSARRSEHPTGMKCVKDCSWGQKICDVTTLVPWTVGDKVGNIANWDNIGWRGASLPTFQRLGAACFSSKVNFLPSYKKIRIFHSTQAIPYPTIGQTNRMSRY